MQIRLVDTPFGLVGRGMGFIGTVKPLEFEKKPKRFIYSPSMKTIPIHIFEVEKLCPFM